MTELKINSEFRNLIASVRIKLALLVESEIAQKAKENSLANLKRNTESDICPTRTTTADLPKEDILPKQDWRAKRETSTNNQLAQMAGVSDKTVQRTKRFCRTRLLKSLRKSIPAKFLSMRLMKAS